MNSVNGRTLKSYAADICHNSLRTRRKRSYTEGMPRPRRATDRSIDPSLSRAQQKQHTRQALLDAALSLMADRSLDALSLREVAQAAGVVPTAFYRHFASVEELGLVLVDEAFRTLRKMMRAAREAELPHHELVRISVQTFAGYVRAQRAYFRFVVRERFGGSAVLRAAIRAEVRLFVSELATDLARFAPLDRWHAHDLQMLAGLIVSVMVGAVELLLDGTRENEASMSEVIAMTEKQLGLVLGGAAAWKAP